MNHLVLCCLLSMILWPSARSQLPPSQVSALLELFNSTHGAQWLDSGGWATHSDPCTWFGVGCQSDVSVSVLSLPGNNLQGTIPPSIADLLGLATLNLSHNSLWGSIPASLGTDEQPTAILSIDLSYNQLSGSVPEELAYFQIINVLNLQSNQLSGSLPANIAHNVRQLRLQNNMLTGSLNLLSTLAYVQSIDVSNNNFTSMPLSRTYWSSLLAFGASNNPSLGGGFSGFSSAGVIQSLRMSNAGIAGSFPAIIANLTSLTSLDLSYNALTNQIPAQLPSSLQSLNLSHNSLDGTVPNQLGSLPLQTLDLSYNQLTGTVPAFFQTPHSLTFTMQCNLFSDPLPSWCSSSQCAANCAPPSPSAMTVTSSTVATTSSTASSSVSSLSSSSVSSLSSSTSSAVASAGSGTAENLRVAVSGTPRPSSSLALAATLALAFTLATII